MRNTEKELEIAIRVAHHNFVITVLDIGRLTRSEKLRAREEVWVNLTRTEDDFQSPDWHGDVLRERENALMTGRDEFVPWEEAKRMLREKTM